MEECERKITELAEGVDLMWQKLRLEKLITERDELAEQVAEPEIWKNPEIAREKNERLARLEEQIQPWVVLRVQIDDIRELLKMGGEDLLEEMMEQLRVMEESFWSLRKALWFLGRYDGHEVTLRISAGAGGVEAMDWAGMLERMYLRHFEKRGWRVSCLERMAGEEAGIKTAVYEVKRGGAMRGEFSEKIYGWLSGEHGVHRLVRLSPFNADNLRQTSFALVEVLPILETEELVIEEKDLRVDVYRAGGHGGQSVNTTDSAVRITHLPTGIVVAIQNERSQIQNREKAMEILRGKLVQLQQEQQVASVGELRAGESASFGQQIRNYVMQPYKLVKDTRTKYEETDVERVLDGELLGFMEAFLGAKGGGET